MPSIIKQNCLSTNNLNSHETNFFCQKEVILYYNTSRRLGGGVFRLLTR
jgi:hypothetical protein